MTFPLLIFLTLFAVIFSTSIWLFIAGIRQMRKIRNIKNWQKTDGIVTNGYTTSRWDSDHTSERVSPVIEYIYTVGKRAYRRHRVDMGIISMRGADDVVASYPIGKHVTVFYNPKNLFEATLSQRAPFFATYGLLLLGLFCMGFSGLMFYGFSFIDFV